MKVQKGYWDKDNWKQQKNEIKKLKYQRFIINALFNEGGGKKERKKGAKI